MKKIMMVVMVAVLLVGVYVSTTHKATCPNCETKMEKIVNHDGDTKDYCEYCGYTQYR